MAFVIFDASRTDEWPALGDHWDYCYYLYRERWCEFGYLLDRSDQVKPALVFNA